jgi:hypothetical protein
MGHARDRERRAYGSGSIQYLSKEHVSAALDHIVDILLHDVLHIPAQFAHQLSIPRLGGLYA